LGYYKPPECDHNPVATKKDDIKIKAEWTFNPLGATYIDYSLSEMRFLKFLELALLIVKIIGRE